ncbi:hypothetical protein BH23BAC1_BH23BAC1_35230 [soil metagenome]
MWHRFYLNRAGIIIFCTIWFLFVHNSFSQNYTQHNWYFGGTGSALLFNKSDNNAYVAPGQQAPMGQGGSAVATDGTSGDLLFYTDGRNVYDASNTLMAPGQPLNGNPEVNQPAVISPVPNEPGQYYIFTNNSQAAPPGISYSIVDMTQPGNASGNRPPLGQIITNNVQISNVATSEAMVLIPGTSPDTYYLITQNSATGVYSLFTISPSGISAPVNYDLTSAGAPSLSAANFSYNQATNKIAVAPKEQNKNVQILNFNPANGTLSFDQQLLNTGNADFPTEAVYDTEWSEDGTKLYISRHGSNGSNTGNIYQYDFGTAPPTYTAILPNPVFRSYGLKRGPDNKIYHLYQATPGGPFLLGSINSPDSVASLVNYQSTPLTSENFDGKQFPEFANSVQEDCNPTFTATNTCESYPTIFMPEVTPPSQTFFWDFGDGTTSELQTPNHIYDAAGTYDVMLRIQCGDRMDSVIMPVNILPNNLNVELVQDTTICPGESLTLDATTQGATSYRWSTGDLTPQITVDSAGFYWVVVSDGSGCEAYSGTNVKIFGEENRIGNIWYFGQGAGMDFNGEVTEALVNPGIQMNAPEGVAVISDRNGDVLFYTDGETVWDREDNVMLNGEDIGGSQNSSQSSIIIPFPDDETLYYIFTTDALYGDFVLRYSIVDIKGNDGLGEVIAKDIPLFEKSSERITAIETGSGYLIIAKEYGNNTFRVYPIDENGIGAPVLSSVGSVHSMGNPASGEGYMKISPDGSKVAVAIPGPPNAVEVFDFNDSTYTLSNPIRLELDNDETPYGIEFSPDGNMLYVSTNNNGSGPSRLYQYQLTYTKEQLEDKNNRNLIDSSPATFGALQVGSDQSIYLAVNGSPVLRQITNPTSNADSTNIVVIDFDLEGRISNLGLPNFIQSIFDQPGDPTMSYSALCVGNESNFVGTPASDIDVFRWTITMLANDSIVHTDTELETVFTFEQAGEYLLEFNVSNRCGYDTTLIDTINILGPPDPPTLPESIAICDGPVVLEAAPATATGLTYLWSTGDTTRTVSIDYQTFVSVTIFNEEGCFSDGEMLVYDGRPEVDLGPDVFICQNEPLILDSQQADATITWTSNGTQVGTERRLQVDTSTPGVFQIAVAVIDPLTNCVGRDTILVTINVIPEAIYTVQENSICGDNEGIIEISSFVPPGNYVVAWTGPNGEDLGNDTRIEQLASGMYTLEVTDEMSGCSNTYSISIPDLTPDEMFEEPLVEVDCDGGTITFNLAPTTVFPITYLLTDVGNNVNIGTRQTTSQTPIIITDLNPSTYILEVVAGGCTVFSDPVDIIAPDSIQLQAFESLVDECVEPGGDLEIGVEVVSPEAGANYTYTWINLDGTGNFTSPTDLATVRVDASGRYQVLVSNPDGTLCPSTEIIEVEIANAPIVAIEPLGDACDGSLILSANTTPDGNYSYLWSNGASSETITITQSGTFSVTVRNQRTGCIAEDGPHNFVVEMPLEVTLSASNACEGSPFSLFAASNQPNVTYTYLGPSGQELATTTDTEFVVGPDLPAGNYSVSAVSATGCTAQASRNVTRVPFEVGQLPGTVTICILDTDPAINSIELDPGEFTAYSWRMPDGRTSSARTVMANQGGLYVVTLTNEIGCTKNDTTEVLVSCEPAIFGPNAFSPNGNNLNETFRLHTRYITDFDIKIFNRWGELIFQANDINFEWDGIYRGRLVQNGTYPYVIRYRSAFDPSLGIKEMRGGVTVVR